MRLDLTFRASDTTPNPPALAVPAGYRLFRAPKYPLVGYGHDLSYARFGFSSFMVIPVWVTETRSFSAVQNFSRIDRATIDKLTALQVIEQDQTIEKKMNWLMHTGTGVSAMWTGDTQQDWRTAATVCVGSMLWGNQLFAASEATYPVVVKGVAAWCRKVLPFRPDYWDSDRPEWAFPRACVVTPGEGISYDWGRGAIRTMLQVMDPAKYPFVGGLSPAAFWLPAEWCLEVS